MRVADVMSRTVHTTAAELPIEAARDAMRRHDVHHLVVMKGGHVSGAIVRLQLEMQRMAIEEATPR